MKWVKRKTAVTTLWKIIVDFKRSFQIWETQFQVAFFSIKKCRYISLEE